jgi:uncharacterized protein YdaU (DUF1376 family)
MSRPWMPLYVGNYIADTQHLTTLEHGAYMLLLMHYWTHGGLPSDEKRLSLIAKLDLKTWRKVRTVLAAFFDPDWKHKRVDEELAKASDIREINRANAAKRWSHRNATADATASANGMPEGMRNGCLLQSQSQLQKDKSQSGAQASADASDEDRFWSRLDDLGKRGIGRSRCTQLLKLIDGDFIEANRVLDATEAAKKPGQYLGAVIRNLERGANAAPLGANSNVPAWVNQKRAGGIPVDREGQHWRCLGELHNDVGEPVGW